MFQTKIIFDLLATYFGQKSHMELSLGRLWLDGGGAQTDFLKFQDMEDINYKLF